MRTRLEIDGNELIITRNSFSGELAYSLNGKKGILQKVFAADAQFVITKKLQYNIKVGDSKIIIVHNRPRFFAAFRNHTFTFLKDGKVIKEVKGR